MNRSNRAKEEGFMPVAPISANVTHKIQAYSLPTTTDKVKIAFTTYNHRLKWTGEWKEYLSLGIGALGLACSIKSESLTVFDYAISRQSVVAFLAIVGVCCLLIATRCIWRAFKYKDKLTCEYFEQQLRADNPDVE